MDNPSYCHEVYLRHYERAVELSGFDKSNYVVLELGPGDSIGTAVFAHIFGARTITLVDSCSAAEESPENCEKFTKYLKYKFGHAFGLEGLRTTREVLRSCNATYLTNGLQSLRKIENNSVDFIFSHAVLEHIKRNEFQEHVSQLTRILRPRGIMSHRIDFKDHMGGGLNNLRFSEELWESRLFAESGFYTNRLRCSEVLHYFESETLVSKVVQEDRWDTIPIPRSSLAKVFETVSEEDLLISGIDIISEKLTE
jgi:SAM-dependent methyltransferase